MIEETIMEEKDIWINKLEKKILRVEEFLVRLFLISLLIDLFLQVFFRYFLKMPIIWTEEIGRYFLVYLAMSGVGIAVKRNVHFSLTFLFDSMGIKLKRHVSIIITLLSMFFCVVLIYASFKLSVETVSLQSSPTLKFPMSIPYAAIPFGAILILFHLSVYLINILKRRYFI